MKIYIKQKGMLRSIKLLSDFFLTLTTDYFASFANMNDCPHRDFPVFLIRNDGIVILFGSS